MTKKEDYNSRCLEFLTVALHFDAIVEKADTVDTFTFVGDLSKILPYLYLKALLVQAEETELPEDVPAVVTQEEYDSVQQTIKQCLRKFDIPVFVPESNDDEGHYVLISELIADIYQDIKNFTVNYRLAPDDERENYAAWLKHTFFEYWGKKLLNVQIGLHTIISDETGEDPFSDEGTSDTKDWIISKRQKDWGYRDEV